jgi:agmatinase
MSNLDLYTSRTNVFSGMQKPFEFARYVVFGVPFDATSTYRSGARFMPNAVRQASLNIETYSFRSGFDMENVPLYDAGDLHVSNETKETLDMCRLVVEDIVAEGKVPVVIGGEHTVTLGVVQGLGERAKKTAVVSFDAHLDLRCDYLGSAYSHTTFMQLINEQVKPAKILEVGTRAVCKDDLAYAEEAGIQFITSQAIKKFGSEGILQALKEELEPFEHVYLTVDLDVLDPAVAPAVQNPEVEGIDLTALLDIACGLCDKRVVGLDVVEIAPNYDQGVSAIVAAKTIFEMLCQLEKTQKATF